MAIPIINDWRKFFDNYDEGLGSSYERVVLNNLLQDVVQRYKIKKVLESPCFGFTGVSGINSMNLAKEGIDVTIMESRGSRFRMIEDLWHNLNYNATFIHSVDFGEFPFLDKQFDMSWNFSAIWFVDNLNTFLSEMVRVTDKVILIIVPNTTGLGYLWQKLSAGKSKVSDEDIETFNTLWIKRNVFTKRMNELGWKLTKHALIDCPPWPDIGMKKEEFIKMIGLSFLLDNDSFTLNSNADDKMSNRTSIIDYYQDKDSQFPEKMMKYYWFEKIMPSVFKMFWAHHHYYLFRPENDES